MVFAVGAVGGLDGLDGLGGSNMDFGTGPNMDFAVESIYGIIQFMQYLRLLILCDSMVNYVYDFSFFNFYCSIWYWIVWMLFGIGLYGFCLVLDWIAWI